MKTSLGKSLAFLSSRLAKALDVDSSSCKSLSGGAKKGTSSRKASDLKDAKKRIEVPPNGDDDIDVDSV